MPERKPVEKKELVRKAYGRIARGSSACCPQSSCCAGSTNSAADVSCGETLNLGCGSPLEHADLRRGEIVVDLGAGAGLDALRAARTVGPEGSVIGVDMTPEMVERATANAARAGLANVRFLRGDIESLPLEDGTVDVVISNCVINLAPDKARVFREAHRVLRPGGRMVVADIILRGPLPQGMADDPALYVACVAGAVSEEEYLDAMRKAGFEDIHVLPTGSGDAAECGPPARGAPVASITVQARKPAGVRAS